MAVRSLSKESVPADKAVLCTINSFLLSFPYQAKGQLQDTAVIKNKSGTEPWYIPGQPTLLGFSSNTSPRVKSYDPKHIQLQHFHANIYTTIRYLAQESFQ